MNGRFGLLDQAADAEPDDFDPATAPSITPEVGKAYLCADGIVRWLYGLTARGGFYTRTFNGARGAWFNGATYERGRGRCRVEDLRVCLEVPAPREGEQFTLFGPLGTPRICTVHPQPAPGAPITLRKGSDNADR